MSHTRSFLFDAGSNYLRMIAAILGTVFLTRAMALHWGLDDFGRWSLITSVMGFALLLDLGLSNIVLKATGSSPSKEAGDVLSSAVVALLMLSLVAGGALMMALYSMFAGRDFTLTIAVLLLTLRATIASLPWTVCRSALYARGKMAQTNLIQSIGVLAYSFVACVALYRGAGLAMVAAISLAFTVLDSVLLFVLLTHYLPDVRLRPRFSAAALRPMLSLGGASVLVNMAGFILLKTDPIIVKTFLPFAEVAIYAVALRIAENIFLLCKQLVNALTPQAIRAGSSGDTLQQARLFERVSRYVMALGAPLYVTSLVLGRPAIRLWLSRDYESSAPLLNILLLAMVLSIPQLVGSNLLTFSGQHKKTATFVTIGAVINVFASVFFVHLFGAKGVAYGTLLTTLLIDVAVVVPFACRCFHVHMGSFLLTTLRSIVLPCVVQAIALMAIGSHLQPTSLLRVILEGASGCAVFAVCFLWIGATSAERQSLIRALLPKWADNVALAEVL
jgi:O-antigen/teichoic acid export membrane protein